MRSMRDGAPAGAAAGGASSSTMISMSMGLPVVGVGRCNCGSIVGVFMTVLQRKGAAEREKMGKRRHIKDRIYVSSWPDHTEWVHVRPSTTFPWYFALATAASPFLWKATIAMPFE